MTILWTIIVGAVIGALARLAMPGRQPVGIIVTILLGIVGAIPRFVDHNAVRLSQRQWGLCNPAFRGRDSCRRGADRDLRRRHRTTQPGAPLTVNGPAARAGTPRRPGRPPRTPAAPTACRPRLEIRRPRSAASPKFHCAKQRTICRVLAAASGSASRGLPEAPRRHRDGSAADPSPSARLISPPESRPALSR